MSTAAHGSQRLILLRAVRGLIDAARSERALLAASSPQRHFYLGVEAAAEEALHPELASARAPGWLDRESPAFREGYLQASTMLGIAASAPEPPLKLALPHPPLG